MKKILIIVFVVFISTISFADNIETVIVEGSGETIEAAKDDARKEAVAQVVSMYVISDSLVRNGVLINDEVLTHSNGIAKSSKTISSKKDEGLWNVSLEVEVVVGKVINRLREANITTVSEPGKEPIFAGAFTDVDKLKKVLRKIILDPIFKDCSAYKKEFIGMDP